MAFDKFLIAPINSGYESSLRPFLIPDDAWQILRNAYVFRGRLRKRVGAILMAPASASMAAAPLYSRLNFKIGTTDGAGAFTGTVPGNKFLVGQQFVVGTSIFTVYQATGAPAAMLDTGAGSGTFDSSNGNVVLTATGFLATPVFWYSAQPVMGFATFGPGSISTQSTYAFDTQFAYVFNTSNGWQGVTATPATPTWHGTNLNYFWAKTWRSQTDPTLAFLFVSNYYAVHPTGLVNASDDPLWYLTVSASSGAAVWTSFQPYLTAPVMGAQSILLTAKIILPFQNRLILLSTIEINAAGTNNTEYTYRCRFSAQNNPNTVATSFLDVTQAGSLGGGIVDLPNYEVIVSAGFVKDRLIVYCERSTWELAYSGGVSIFQWLQINEELGVESTFSIVPFDKQLLGFGATGIHACNGSNTFRIDQLIPDFVFPIKDRFSTSARIAATRDYANELVYWSFPYDANDSNTQFPNKVLQYNYENETWATYDDAITAFGTFEQTIPCTWADWETVWEENNQTWADLQTQDEASQVIAGNQQGFTFIIRSDVGRNAPVISLNNVTLSGGILTFYVNFHNFSVGDFVCIENAQGSVNLNGLVFQVTTLGTSGSLGQSFTAPAPSIGFTLGGTYTGGGTITRMSVLSAVSKQWNPYDKDAANIYLARIDFYVEKTTNGQVTVDYFPSSSYLSMIAAGQSTGAIMGNNILSTAPYDPQFAPVEQYQTRLCHPIYFQTSGTCIQIWINHSQAQIMNTTIAWSDFEIDAIMLFTKKSGRMQ